MAMNFDIPDISETAAKAVTGGKKRKTRKIGALRLGDTLKMIANHFTCTEESRDEDKNIAFYSLSEGDEKASFYGEEVSLTGVCIYRKKTVSIYVELPTEKRAALMQALMKEAGEAQASSAMDIFADTVTSIFVTRPAKGDKSFTIALMDSEAAKAFSDQAAIEAEEKNRQRGLWDGSFPRSLIPWAVSAADPISRRCSLSAFRPSSCSPLPASSQSFLWEMRTYTS